MKNKQSIKQKLNAQEIKVAVAIRIIGSIIITLSGFLIISDKVLYFNLSNNFGFSDTQTFIWVLAQSLSPLLILIGSLLRPYRVSYLIPIYLYTIQICWIFDPALKIDDALLHIYAAGACVLFVFSSIIVNSLYVKAQRNKADRETVLKSMLDLTIKINDRYNE